MPNLNLECFQLSFDVYIVYIDKNCEFLKIVGPNWKFSNQLTLVQPYGKTTEPRNLFKVSKGVQRCKVSFETMFGLILGEIGAIEAQKVRWADSTPPWFLNGPKSMVCLGLRE